MTKITSTSCKLSALLMVGASSLAVASPAKANEYLFTQETKPLQIGERQTQNERLTQVRLNGGGTASFTDKAEYQVNADGSVELYKGSVTVAGAAEQSVMVRMPEGLEGEVMGRGSAANFRVQTDGEATGHVFTGKLRLGRNKRWRRYDAGAMWAAGRGSMPRRVMANAAQTAPEADDVQPQVAAISDDAGPVGAALNGIPVTLGDALAGAGASSDIISAARRVELGVGNPTLDTFPSGDLALLVARAAEIEAVYGGSPFRQAQADIIRTYLRFLAEGGAGAQFLSSFSAFSLDYLDLIRVGGVPTAFADAGFADINAYLAFIERTGALAQLGAQDRVLAEAYLGFLRDGGNPDLFAATFTDLTNAYFAFVRAGNAPEDFQGASHAALGQTISFLSDSGLVGQLSAADQALVSAFLANGGLGFEAQFQAALNDYFAFLNAGGLTSAYQPVDQVTLRQFLETLSETGLLASVLGNQAQFYTDYLVFLRAGGDVDAFAGLNANVFAGYASDLQAYFAFLEAGGVPSTYEPLSQAIIAQYLAELQAAGATGTFLPELGDFYAAYFAFVSGGGNPDNFAQLPVPPDHGAFAASLNAYADFLAAGGFPADFSDEDLSVLASFIEALESAGELDARLGANAELLEAYFAFLANGGSPNQFAGLPIYAQYVADLNAYFAFLAGGGLPEDYAVLDAATLTEYLEALAAAQGGLTGFGNLNDFFDAYAAFVLGGGDPTAFAGLPVFAQYVADLNAYFAFLAGGGLPSEYTVLDQATLNAYLELLANAQGGLAGFAGLDAFFLAFFAFLVGGGDADQFEGLPANMGGGGGGGTGSGGPLLGYAGGFDATSDLNIYANTEVSQQSRIGQDGSVDDQGVFTSPFFDLGTSVLTDIGGDASAVIGRFTNGTINTIPGGLQTLPENGGLAYAVVAPFTGTIPTTGTIEYDVLSATRPVFYDGAAAPGTFDADLAFTFGGSRVTYRLAGEIAIGDETYVFGTGSNFASTQVADFEAAPQFVADRITLTPQLITTGRACPTGDCTLQFLGGLAGDSDAERVAFTYRSFPTDRSFSNPGQPERDLIGAVIFGAVGTFDGGGDTGGGDDLSATLPGSIYLSGSGGSSTNSSNLTFSVTDSGQITNVQRADGSQFVVTSSFTPLADRGWDLVDEGRIGDILALSAYRITDIPGQDNSVVYYLGGPPAINLPQMGIVTYALVDGTAPSSPQSAQGEFGFFTGEMAVAFGTQTRIGINFNIEIDDVGFSATTPGGAADPAQSNIVLRNNDGVFASQIGISGTSGDACTGNCFAFVQGGLFGDGASHGGFVYTVRDNIRQFAGTAVFEAGGTAIDSIGTRPGGGTGGSSDTLIAPDFTGTLADQFTFVGNSGARGTGDASYVNGALVGFEATGQFASVADAANATISDTGANADMAWARWSDGPIRFNGGVEQTPATLSYHAVSGNATQTLPTTGTVNYDLIATTPLTMDGSTQQGTLSGDMAIAFGTTPTVGLAIEAALGNRTWSVETAGGIADPSQSGIEIRENPNLNFGASFNNLTGATRVTGTGGACADICGMTFDGNLFGTDGRSVGLFVGVSNRENGTTTDMQGLMLFQAAGSSGATSAADTRGLASVAPSAAPAASADWSRWSGTGGASSQGTPAPQALGLVPPGASATDAPANPATRSREAAIRHAERIMGGAITFGRGRETSR